MAERRMFAKSIVLSDPFLDLPMSARCLYFTLSMFADDDGFINAPKGIMRQAGCSEDDMKLLIAKAFVIPFESGVVVIRHWRINNYLQKDRINPTKCIAEKQELSTDETGAYQKLYTQSVYTQNSIEKSRVDKDSINNDQNPSDFDREFERVWYLYPRKEGRKKALEAYVRARKKGTGAEEIESGVRRYLDHIRAERTEKKYVMQGSTYFSGQRWTDKYEEQREEYGELYDL